MRSFLRAVFWIVGVLAVIGLALRLTVMRTWVVPDDAVLDVSMAPSLAGGDTVILWTRGQRGFGELVRCNDPEDAQRWVVGRIVGLEGDTVEVQGGVVRVNGTRYNVSDACQKSRIELTDKNGNQYEATCSRVEMAGGWHFRAMVVGESPESPVKATIGPGLVYLLSDNRSLHDDSRDFGAIPAETCKELIIFRLWDRDGFFGGGERFTTVR